MRTLEATLRSIHATLGPEFYVSMTYWPASSDHEAYWNVSINGNGPYSRFSATVSGRNPLACLRYILNAEERIVSYTPVAGGQSRSAAVREVEALAEAHSLWAVSFNHFPQSDRCPEFWSANVHEAAYLCAGATSHGPELSLRSAIVDALNQIRRAA